MTRYLAALALLLLTAGFASPSGAQSAPPSSAPPSSAPASSAPPSSAPASGALSPPPSAETADQTDPAEAKALITRMADFLSKAQSFSLTMDAGFDVTQDSGQKIEFGEIRHILVNRPNDLRIDTELSSGEKQQLIFNGHELTLFTPADNVFASMDKAGTVDDILRYIVFDLQTPIPLSLFLAQSMPQVIEARAVDFALVEHTRIAGRPATHVAGRMADVDFQIWIADGDQPVPLRAIITYKLAAGEPQFWANLSDWNFAPNIDPAAFTFVKPPGAQSVAFLVPAAEHAKRPGKVSP